MVKKVLASLSSVIAALLASSCCWLPFVLIGLGISGGALAATMSKFRPLFLVVALLALGYALYLYVQSRKKEACCEKKKGIDWQLISLVFTGLVVVAIAFYPLYYPLLPKQEAAELQEKSSCDSGSPLEKLDSLENKAAEKSSCCP